MELCHIGKKGGSNSFSSSAILQMDDMQHLAKPVHNDQQADVSFWRRDDQKVHSNIMPKDARHVNGLQVAARVCVFSFGALTDVAGGSILLHLLSHLWELILSTELVKGAGNAHVTSVVVVCLQQLVSYRQRYSHPVPLRGDAI